MSVQARLRSLVTLNKGQVQFKVPDDEEGGLAWEAFNQVPSSLQDLTKVAQHKQSILCMMTWLFRHYCN